MSSGTSIEAMVGRIEDVTDAIHEILNEDPAQMLAQRKKREEHREQERARREEEKLLKVKMRYEPKFYSRFERDDFIDALLRETDETSSGTCRPGRSAAAGGAVGPVDLSLYTKSERISIEEAQRLKSEGAKSVQQADWTQAEALYTAALKLLSGFDEDDEPLLALATVLRNNRALVRNKLGDYMGAVEDTTNVLRVEARNVKALLRRATALRRLHRPVEALKDVAEVRRWEPRNAEAAQQYALLEKAEAELSESERFMQKGQDLCEAEGATAGRNPASVLCDAVAVICETCSLFTGREAEAASAVSDSTTSRVAQALLDVSRAFDEHLTGAAALFAVRGGFTPTVKLALGALSVTAPSATHRAILTQALTVLTTALELSEVILQEADGTLSTELITRLVDRIPSVTEDMPVLTAIVLALAQLAKGFHAAVVAALRREEAATVLTTLFERSRSSAPLLHAFLGLLDSLMRHVSGDRAETVEALGALLFAPSHLHGAVGPTPLLLAVAGVAVDAEQSSIPAVTRPMLRLQGLRFFLRLTCFAAAPECASKGRRQAIVDAVSSPAVTRKLYHIAAVTLGTSGGAAPSTAELDALYAVIHNLILTAPSRSEYLQHGWLSPTLSQPSLFTLTLAFLQAQSAASGTEGFLFTPACASMLATVQKLCPSGATATPDVAALTQDTVSQLARVEPLLWEWLEAVAARLRAPTQAAPLSLCQSLAEHLATLLGYLSIQRKGTPSAASTTTGPFLSFETTEDGVSDTGALALDALFACLQSGQCLSEASVVALAEGSSAAPSVSPLILLGAAALLLSSVAEMFPNHARCYQELVRHKAIDVLLLALREARTSLLTLKREAARKENASLASTLSLWIQHTSQTQQNLCIAIGKVCAVQGSVAPNRNGEGDSLLDRLHQLSGFETLAAAFNRG